MTVTPMPRIRLPDVRIEPLAARPDADVISMIVEASQDPEIRRKNYLPAGLDDEGARRYCATSDAVVLYLGDRAVGLAAALPEASPGEGVEVPAGSVELDMWVLAPFRGQGPRWFPLIADRFAERFDHIVGCTWEDNRTAIALLRWSGWRRIGRSYWTCPGMSGWCEVFLYDLAAHRARA